MRDKQRSVWNYIKGYKLNSILFKNLIYIIVFVILPMLLVVSLNYHNFNKEVNNHMMDMNRELLQKSAVVVDNIITDAMSKQKAIANDKQILSAVLSKKTDMTHDEDIKAAIAGLRENTISNSFIKEVYLYSSINRKVLTNKMVIDMDKVDYKDKWYHIYKNVSMDVPYILVNHGNSIYICEQLTDPEVGNIGIIVLEIDFKNIRDVLENSEINQKGLFFLMDYSGRAIYCSNPEWFAQEKAQQYNDEQLLFSGNENTLANDRYVNNKVISVVESGHQSWYYMLISDAPVYEEETQAIRSFLVTSVAVAICTSVLASLIITFVTYKPIRKILDIIEKPHLHWNIDHNREKNELLYVASNILNSRNEREELSQELNERIKMLRHAQFRSLQFQIDPHFLYNTLESIKWCAVESMGIGNKVSKMISKMAQFYRAGLENNDVIISVRQELEYLKMYAEVLSIRFGDSLMFQWNVDESLLECKIIKMCMQPLVENAINHGLRPKSYNGKVMIDIYHDESKLYVAVRNDGEGMSARVIDQMNENLKSGVGFEENKVGLKNVNERIKLIYGAEYGVHLECDWRQEENRDDKIVDMRVIMEFPYRA